MFRILIMNGLLISLILIWTSAAKEPSVETLVNSSAELPTGPQKSSLIDTNKEILSRKFSCGKEFGGVCIYHKKSCPSSLPSEMPQGQPYCFKKHRCCYIDPTTAAPTTIVPTTIITEDPTTAALTRIVPTTIITEDVTWSDIINACIKGNNFKTFEKVSIDVCKGKCLEEAGITCKSIEYSYEIEMCSLSEAQSNSDDYIEPCSFDGWFFAEIELNTGPATGAPTTMTPKNTTTNGPATGAPITTAPSNTTTNSVSCSLVWNFEEERPLIMIRDSHVISPPIINISISDDPNRIPEGVKLIFACPGEENVFNHASGVHSKLHGECISKDLFQVCVNNKPEIKKLGEFSCSNPMQPSIIQQEGDSPFKKSCEYLGGTLFKIGYIYGDFRDFKDLETNICFREEDHTMLWTSTNVNRMGISASMEYKDEGLTMNTFYTQKSKHETMKEVLDKEATSVWNDSNCRNHGGHCVRGGKPCPEHLPYQTSQGEPHCNSFYRCCYSEPCNPATCTHKGQKGSCSLDSLPGTTYVGSQECKKGCQCFIKDNKTLHHFKSLLIRSEFSKMKKKCNRPKSCKPEKCTHKGQKGRCSLDSLPGSAYVGSQECMNKCKCYIKRPLQLWRGDEHLETFTQNMHEDSREAFFGVWIKGNFVFKLFSFPDKNKKKKKMKKLKTDSDKAIKNGVPTSELELLGLNGGTYWFDEDSKVYEVTVAVTLRATGKFFQVSKPGGVSICIQLINALGESVRKTVKEFLINAIEVKISDPQGFVNKDDNANPITFIDIHVGSISSTKLKICLEGIND